MFGLPLPSVSRAVFSSELLPGGGVRWTTTTAGRWWLMGAIQGTVSNPLPTKTVFSMFVEHLIPDEPNVVLLDWRWMQREFFPLTANQIMVWRRSRRDPPTGFPASHYAAPLPIGTSVDIPPDASANPAITSGDQPNPYLTATAFGPPWASHYFEHDATEVLYGDGLPVVGYPLPAIQAKSPRVKRASTNIGTELPEPAHLFVSLNEGESIRWTVRRFECDPSILDPDNGLLSDVIPVGGGPAPDEQEVSMNELWVHLHAIPVWL